MFVLIAVAVLVLIISCVFLYARWNYGSLEGMGIPVVKPHFLLGSTHSAHSQVHVEEDLARFKKFGPVFGVYEGRTPQVHVCDADLIRAIFVKDFDHFDRRRPANEDTSSPLLNEIPDFIQDLHKWKLIRQISSPTFTGGKLKLMSGPMEECVDEFVDNWKNQIDQSGNGQIEDVDTKPQLLGLTTDMVINCLFGIKAGNQDLMESETNFVQFVRNMCGVVDLESSWTTSDDGADDAVDANATNPSDYFKTGYIESLKYFQALSMSFPILNKFATNFAKDANEFLVVLKTLIASRINSERPRTEKDWYLETVRGWFEKLNSDDYKSAKITETTLLCQPTVIFFAAGDQMSTALTYLFYKACKNQQIQKKIYQELDSFLEKHEGVISIENSKDLHYLTACINESLRLYPYITRLERICTKDWTSEDGTLRIRKGMNVTIPIWASNRNPKYFEDAEEFIPDRFLPENKKKIHPCAYTTFGHGPRNCFGQRFAVETMVLMAAYLYRDFQFEIPKDAPKDVKYSAGSIFMAYCDPICFNIKTRK